MFTGRGFKERQGKVYLIYWIYDRNLYTEDGEEVDKHTEADLGGRYSWVLSSSRRQAQGEQALHSTVAAFLELGQSEWEWHLIQVSGVAGSRKQVILFDEQEATEEIEKSGWEMGLRRVCWEQFLRGMEREMAWDKWQIRDMAGPVEILDLKFVMTQVTIFTSFETAKPF